MNSPFALAATLAKLLPDGYQLAPRPDHPYLLQAPSVLIGGEGRLTALFILGKSATEASLSARITAARLALPSTARIVAIIATGAAEHSPRIQRHFDEVFSAQDQRQSITHYVRSDAKSRTKVNDLLAAKHLHTLRWSAATQITALRRKQQVPSRSAQVLVNEVSLRASEMQIQSNSYRQKSSATFFRGSQVRALPIGSSLMPSLRDAWERGLRRTYTLDDGVPYSDVHSPPSLLLVDSWPDVRFDPEKPFRAAAFGGWVMASSSDLQDVLQLIERTQEFFRRKVHERTQG